MIVKDCWEVDEDLALLPSLSKRAMCAWLFVSVLHPKALYRLIHHPQDERGYPPVLVLIITSYRNLLHEIIACN